jgi:hypothetical protein
MHILLGLLVTNTKETRKVSLHDKKRATAPTAYVRVGGLSGNHFPTKDRKLLLRTFYPGRLRNRCSRNGKKVRWRTFCMPYAYAYIYKALSEHKEN